MNGYLNICVALSVLFLGNAFASAQGGYGVSGVVQDEEGPVIGAAVVEQGTSNGTSTGTDGSYSLTVSSPDAMVEKIGRAHV